MSVNMIETPTIPFRFGVYENHLWVDSYLPLNNISHGKLRIWQKMVQIELLEMIQHHMKEEKSLLTRELASSISKRVRRF